MPKSDGSGKGNLLIEFNVRFPKHIPEHQKKVIGDILADE